MPIAFTVAMIEFAAFKCRPILWIAGGEFAVRVLNAWELTEKLGAAMLNQRRKSFVVVGEVQKGSQCSILLTLEQQWRGGTEKQQCR